MARSTVHAVALAAALSCGPVGAAVVASYTNSFDIEFFDNSPDVWLTSDVLLNAGFASLKYTVSYQLLDVGLDVTWYDQNNSVLVHGGGGYASGHYAYSLDVDYVGQLAPVIGHRLFGGKADFSAGQVQKFPCFSKVCPTSHYDWAHNAPPSPAPGPQQATFATASGAEGLDETRATLSVLVPDVNDPDNRDADTVLGLYRFTSAAKQLAAGWQYRYTVTNLTASEVDVDLELLQLSGLLAPGASREVLVTSDAAPGLLRTTPSVRRDDGPFGDMRFDALAPVPDIPSGWALAAGLPGLTLLMRRRRRARKAWDHPGSRASL
ncbi:MAG: hypothetical protein IV097_05440 [Burkholderiaceae bacterium]|nr:hypothetical protein [Burkholderiaceae bacterium]